MTGACAAAAISGQSTGFKTTASPGSVSAYGSSGATASLTTSSTTVAVTGGVPSFTYAWAAKGVPPYAWTIGSPSAATTNFTATNVEAGVQTSAVFECTVTDHIGAISKVSVDAYANNGQPFSAPIPSTPSTSEPSPHNTELEDGGTP